MARAICMGVVLCMLLSGCTKDHANGNSCTSCPANVSFSKALIPVFAQSCAINGNACHAGANSVSLELDLDSAAAYSSCTLSGRGIVDTANPGNSFLYAYLLYPTTNPNHMPLNAPSLDQCTIEEIYCWIQQGAMNN